MRTTRQQTQVGYVRVSPAEDAEHQIAELRANGVRARAIYRDTVASTDGERPQLRRAMSALRDGGVLVVWRLDRLARSQAALAEIVDELAARGASLRSVVDDLDVPPRGSRGALIRRVIGACARLDRDLVAARSRAGMDRARANGVRIGAQPKISESDMPDIHRLIHREGRTRREVAEQYNVSAQTIWRRMREYQARDK